jgi:hypothetical protein
MFIMPPFNHYILTFYSHRVITVLWCLQIFLCPTSYMLRRVPCSGGAIQRPPLHRLRPSASINSWPLGQPLGDPDDLRSIGIILSSAAGRDYSFLQNNCQRCWWSRNEWRSMRGVGLHRGSLRGLRPASPTKVETEFKIYSKYIENEIDLKILKNLCKWDLVLVILSNRKQRWK